MLLNMAEVNQVILLNEFNTFLSQLPQWYEELRSNRFTQELEVGDSMLILSERICSFCVIFLLLFDCFVDQISREIVEKLQELLYEYEQLSRQYSDVVKSLQEHEADNRFRCQNEFPSNEKSRGRRRFHVTKAQIESLREIGFSWTKVAQMIGVSWVTLYRRRQELGLSEMYSYSTITDAELDAVVKSIVDQSPNSGQVMMRGALIGRGLRIQ